MEIWSKLLTTAVSQIPKQPPLLKAGIYREEKQTC